MASMCIDRIEPLNTMVHKLVCETSEFQVYSAFYNVFEGDLINVRISHNKENNLLSVLKESTRTHVKG